MVPCVLATCLSLSPQSLPLFSLFTLPPPRAQSPPRSFRPSVCIQLPPGHPHPPCTPDSAQHLCSPSLVSAMPYLPPRPPSQPSGVTQWPPPHFPRRHPSLCPYCLSWTPPPFASTLSLVLSAARGMLPSDLRKPSSAAQGYLSDLGSAASATARPQPREGV